MSFTRLKQELDTAFEKIKSVSENGDLPSVEDVKHFVRLCDQMQTRAPEDWAYEADDFTHLARELLQTLRQGRSQEFFPLIDSLEVAKNYCHRTFKTM